MSRPCPSWCALHDYYDDGTVVHIGPPVDLRLAGADGPTELALNAADPAVPGARHTEMVLTFPGGPGMTRGNSVALSFDEAERVAADLLRLIRVGRAELGPR